MPLYYLYHLNKNEKNRLQQFEQLKNCRITSFAPTPMKLMDPAETGSLKMLLSRIYFWLITNGKYRIFLLFLEDSLAHCAYVIPKCRKFPFLNKADYEIGPCVTFPEFRRRGCYLRMLDHITSSDICSGGTLYMLVNKDNNPSIRGIEKAGFTRCGTVHKTVFKNYVVEK